MARIEVLREGIDEIDGIILSLINNRLKLGKEIGRAKSTLGKQVLDTSRETRVMERLTSLNTGPLADTVVAHIFNVIMAATREIQKPKLIAYLGPEATYSHIAALDYFGHAGSFVPQPSIQDIFTEVEKGTYQYGVVPVENSIEGSVNHTLDLLFETRLSICAEKYMSISHDLVSQVRDLAAIRVVYSHPQALAQCRGWLRANLPHAVLRECSSTAHAARQASVEPVSAAIASSRTCQIYDLQVVASRIEDNARNVTRFLVIGDETAAPTGTDKTSIMFVTSHIPGALFKALEPVASSELNMVKLESRPIKRENWSYFFIMDIEGHIADAPVRAAVNAMKQQCLFLKSLGSYPRGLEPDPADAVR
ncbi:MAG: prephenate dehydratase [Deltaproteobacteria bacterium]|nr:MAG: prephenate dehydratase [Deltaproteobacteria bacterium]